MLYLRLNLLPSCTDYALKFQFDSVICWKVTWLYLLFCTNFKSPCMQFEHETIACSAYYMYSCACIICLLFLFFFWRKSSAFLVHLFYNGSSGGWLTATFLWYPCYHSHLSGMYYVYRCKPEAQKCVIEYLEATWTALLKLWRMMPIYTCYVVLMSKYLASGRLAYIGWWDDLQFMLFKISLKFLFAFQVYLLKTISNLV